MDTEKEDLLVECIARAWATGDRNVKSFDLCKLDARWDRKDATYSHYMQEARMLLDEMKGQESFKLLFEWAAENE
jgi:hypothetical protein